MSHQDSTRREWLAQAPVAVALGTLVAAPKAMASPAITDEPIGLCFNTSTIMGQKLPADKQMEIVAKAGYAAVEPWIRDLDDHAKSGKSLADLGKKIKDLGLAVPSAIGFAEWAVDDDARRSKGLEQMKRDMETVQKVGGTRIAAPPVGATDREGLDLRKAAERYRAILKIGDQIGVVPQVEIWGFSKNICRLGEAAMVAIDARHPSACILADVYHLYRGGSDFSGVKLLNSSALHVFHMNDYPAQPPRQELTDAQRVYPGDGVAPLAQLIKDLRSIGYRGYLSLELFNRKLWEADPQKVAQDGFDKMKQLLARS